MILNRRKGVVDAVVLRPLAKDEGELIIELPGSPARGPDERIDGFGSLIETIPLEGHAEAFVKEVHLGCQSLEVDLGHDDGQNGREEPSLPALFCEETQWSPAHPNEHLGAFGDTWHLLANPLVQGQGVGILQVTPPAHVGPGNPSIIAEPVLIGDDFSQVFGKGVVVNSQDRASRKPGSWGAGERWVHRNVVKIGFHDLSCLLMARSCVSTWGQNHTHVLYHLEFLT